MAYEAQMIAVSSIKAAPFNPPNRVEARNLKQLKASIEKNGLFYPLLITPQYELIDGHRRLACVVDLGWTEAPCRIANVDLESGWVDVNQWTKPIKAASWWQAADNGLDITKIPQPHRQRIELARKWLGVKGSKELSDRSKSTDVVKQAINVARYIGQEDDEIKGKILRWIVMHEMSFNVHNYIIGQQPSELLYQAIVSDKPISRGWAIL